MTQSILYGEYHIPARLGDYTLFDTPAVNGFILVRDDDTKRIIGSYEGLATGPDGKTKVIGILPSDTIKVYANDTFPSVYSNKDPHQVLFTGSEEEVKKLLDAADLAGSAINNHNIGYPMLGIAPTDKSMAISNSNAVILSLLHIMGLPDPGPTWGFAPGRGTLLFVPGEENALRNYLGLPDTSENGSAILQNQSYGYEYDKTDENGVQLYDIKYDTEHNSEFIGGNAPDLTLDNSNINFASNSSGRIVGDFDEININSGSKVNFNGTNIEISATYASLNLEDKSSADITGNKDVIKLENSVRATINGSGDTVNALGANDLVVAGGNGRTADALDTIAFANGGTAGVAENSRVDVYGNGVTTTLNGNDISGVYGSGDTVNATGADDDIWISGQNNNITASNASINFFASSLANVFGQDDFVQLQSDANSKISITGHDFTVDGDSGNNATILNSDTSAKISGGVNIVINGEDTVLFANNDEEFNIPVESGVTIGAIYARKSIISLPTGWHGDVSGEGNIITGGGDIGGGDIGGGDIGGGDIGGGDIGGFGEGLERAAQYVTTSLRGDPSSDRQPSPAGPDASMATAAVTDAPQGVASQAIQLTSAIASFSPPSGSDTGQSGGQTETHANLAVDPSQTPLHQATRQAA